MLGLLRAAWLLAPVVASVAVETASDDVDKTLFNNEDFTVTLRSYAINDLTQHSLHAVIKVSLPDIIVNPLELPALLFDVQVPSSEQACADENVTVNGEELAQDSSRRLPASSSGSVSLTADDTPIEARWSFECIGQQDGPQFQLLNLLITRIDDLAVPDNLPIGFAMQFSRVGVPQVQRITLHYQGNLAPFDDEPVDDAEFSDRLEFELAELDNMVSQLRILEHLIEEQREAIARYNPEFVYNIRACHSLKCILKAGYHKIHCWLRKIYQKIHGGHYHHGHDKHGNHTCGHKPGKGNHTHPHPHPHPPHWRRPHHGIPICRLPPPHHPPHHPPQHGPVHHWPPHNEPHDRPPHHPDPDLEMPSHGMPHFVSPDNPGYFHLGRPAIPGHRHPDKQEEGNIRTVPSFSEAAGLEDGTHPPPPHHFQGHGPPHHGLPHHGPRALHFLKFIATGIVIACLAFALYRRACTASHRAERRARREERRRRRAFNRARRHQVFRRFIARLTGQPFDEALFNDDYDEKRAALLANAENGLSDTMSEEIAQFRNAADLVGDIVAVEGQFPLRVGSRSMTAHEIGSQIGEEEELPAYEDGGDSEVSSVADGLRYTPGSTEYDPTQSREGSVSDILGPDTKN